MANRRSRPGVTGVRTDECYGPGASDAEARQPFFPGETDFIPTIPKSVESPHGSNFVEEITHDKFNEWLDSASDGGLGGRGRGRR